VLQGEENYRNYVDVETRLTTNSAFASMYGALGWLAFPIVALTAFAFSVVAGHAANYRNAFFLMAYVISYSFAELWRVYLFNFGILHFLIIVLLIIPIVVALLRPSKNS
jgi:biotin transporter BioY